MKVLLSTICDNSNIGTYLQIYATVRKLEARGNDVTLLNYERVYLLGRAYALELWKDKPFIIRHALAVVYAIINRVKINHTKAFLIRHGIHLTKKYRDLDSIIAAKLHYDLYVTGSDQVWNSVHNAGLDEVFFLNFTEGKKVSYASSIGTNGIDEKNRDLFLKYLRTYSVLSVRENAAKHILEEMGFKNVSQVLDPTLLLNQHQWSAIADNTMQLTEKFLLVYTVEGDKDGLVERTAIKIAKAKGLKIYYISPTKIKSPSHYVDKYFDEVSPEIFLLLFLKAEFTVVSSFHGTAFSINFNKQFVTIAPQRFNSRVVSLLETFGIQDVYISKDSQTFPPKINYENVNHRLDELRKESESIIDSFFQ
jgi:hypothetical protein